MKSLLQILAAMLLSIPSILTAEPPNDPIVLILGPTNEIYPRNNVWLGGDYVYATRGTETGFEIIDPTISAEPQLVGSHTGLTSGISILVQSNLAYWTECCTPDRYVAIADVSNPTNILELSRQGGLVDPRGMFLADGILYVADYSTFRMFDVAGPTNIVLLSATPTAGLANDIAARDGFAYVASGNYGFEVFATTNPLNPTAVTSINLGVWANNIQLHSNLAYVSAIGGLRIIDISSPTNPVLVGSYLTNRIHGFRLTNALMYASAGMEGIQVLDISSPTNPLFLAATTTANFVRSIAIDDNHIYATDPFTIAAFRPLGAEAITALSPITGSPDFIVQWESAPGRSYTVQSSTTLSMHPISWTGILTNIPATPPVNAATVSLNSANGGFISLGISTNE